MRNFFTLVKVQFLSFFGLNRILHQDKSKKLSGFGGMAIFALIFVGAVGYLGYTYAKTFATPLLLAGDITQLLPLMLALSCLICFFFSFYSTAGMLYGYRDYEMLMSMPIKTPTIVFAKFTFTYLANLLLSLIILVPSLIVYFDMGQTLLLEDCVRLFLLWVFSPFLPMAISVLVGAVVAYLSSRFRRKNIAQTIMLLLIVGGCFALGFSGEKGMDYSVMIKRIYFVLPLMIDSLWAWGDLLVFVAVNLLPFIAVMLVVAFTYKFMNTVIKSKKKSKGYKLKNYSSYKQSKALLIKEIKRLFSDANYTMNSIIGPILGVVGTIALSVSFGELGMDITSFLFIFPVIFSFGYMMAPPTNCSISLEGSAFWVVKTAPIGIKNLLFNKLLVNIIFGVTPAFIAGLVATIVLRLSWYYCVIISLLAICIAMLGGIVGLFFDLLFPKMKWESPVQVVKRSVSVTFTMLTAVVFTGICFAIGYFVPFSTLVNLVIVLSLTVVLNLVLHFLVFTKGEKFIIEKT